MSIHYYKNDEIMKIWKEGDLIYKQYLLPDNEAHDFEMEIMCLQILAKTDICPQLIDYDIKTKTLSMSVVGKCLFECKKIRLSSKKVDKQLKNIYNVLCENRIFHRDLRPNNICFDGKKLRVIDFGNCIKGHDVGLEYMQTCLDKIRVFIKDRNFYHQCENQNYWMMVYYYIIVFIILFLVLLLFYWIRFY